MRPLPPTPLPSPGFSTEITSPSGPAPSTNPGSAAIPAGVGSNKFPTTTAAYPNPGSFPDTGFGTFQAVADRNPQVPSAVRFPEQVDGPRNLRQPLRLAGGASPSPAVDAVGRTGWQEIDGAVGETKRQDAFDPWELDQLFPAADPQKSPRAESGLEAGSLGSSTTQPRPDLQQQAMSQPPQGTIAPPASGIQKVPATLASTANSETVPRPTTPATSATAMPKLAEPGPAPATAQPTLAKPAGVSDPTQFKLAAQPALGDHFDPLPPETGREAQLVPYNAFDFSPDPIDPALPYDPTAQMDIYQGKTLYSNERPLLELGRPWYQLGQLKPGYTFLGDKNLVTPQFIVFGDYRQAVSSATQANGDNQSFLAAELNLFFDFKVTSTERFHFNMTPLDTGLQASKFRLDDDLSFDNQLNPNVNFGFFEGDLGALVGGAIDRNMPFDAPFTIGVIPLLFQNGVWMEDAFLGVAATVPARNSALLDISNMDTTFFYGWDRVTSSAFEGQDNQGKIYGVANFIEALGGYFELDYAFLEDRDNVRDRSYHNIGLSYTRRYGRWVSNSTRVIINGGQSSSVPNTADGVLVLSENSFITANPSTFIPYVNLFAGFDRPQSAARAAFAGEVLRNTGILFETDGMTAFPTLDATANDTYGGAIGLNILAKDFSQQLVLEAAMVQVHGNAATRNAPGDQYGIGFRYQLPLTNADLVRIDGLIGFLDNSPDINGIRVELRHKW